MVMALVLKTSRYMPSQVRILYPPPCNKSQSDLNVAETFKFLKKTYYVLPLKCKTDGKFVSLRRHLIECEYEREFE